MAFNGSFFSLKAGTRLSCFHGERNSYLLKGKPAERTHYGSLQRPQKSHLLVRGQEGARLEKILVGTIYYGSTNDYATSQLTVGSSTSTVPILRFGSWFFKWFTFTPLSFGALTSQFVMCGTGFRLLQAAPALLASVSHIGVGLLWVQKTSFFLGLYKSHFAISKGFVASKRQRVLRIITTTALNSQTMMLAVKMYKCTNIGSLCSVKQRETSDLFKTLANV